MKALLLKHFNSHKLSTRHGLLKSTPSVPFLYYHHPPHWIFPAFTAKIFHIKKCANHINAKPDNNEFLLL